jgi:hypothetical protein
MGKEIEWGMINRRGRRGTQRRIDIMKRKTELSTDDTDGHREEKKSNGE